jgi:hypothetical protein
LYCLGLTVQRLLTFYAPAEERHGRIDIMYWS